MGLPCIYWERLAIECEEGGISVLKLSVQLDITSDGNSQAELQRLSRISEMAVQPREKATILITSLMNASKDKDVYSIE